MRCSAHTIGLSDFPCSFIVGVCPWTSRRDPRLHQPRANTGPPGSRAKCFGTCTGSLTARDPVASRDIDATGGAFRFSLQRRRPGASFFRGSIPYPHVPLSTLRRFPCGKLRMTRGRCGSLPVPVHRRRMSLDFPTRPAVPSSASEHGTSRFSCEVFPYVLGVSDRAGPCRISRYRCNGCSLPLTSTASASRRKVVSRLHTQPARAPVNASPLPLRKTAHDSGPLWVASLSTCDSFIHNTSPVYPGAQGEANVTQQSSARTRAFRGTFL